MSRIGKKPVPVLAAKVSVAGQLVKVEGAKGKLERLVHPMIAVALDSGKKELVVTRKDNTKQSKALHGLTRALLANMITGATVGYKKNLEIQGVGYKAEVKGKNLILSVGFANTIPVAIPVGVAVVIEGSRISVTGADNQLVGQFASDVRRVRKPEPYKGKGVRYEGEVVKIKPGKAVTGAAAK